MNFGGTLFNPLPYINKWKWGEEGALFLQQNTNYGKIIFATIIVQIDLGKDHQ